MRGLKRAQMEIDLRPERYKRHYLKEILERFRKMAYVRQFGTGERIMFLPYTGEALRATQDWMRRRSLFADAAA